MTRIFTNHEGDQLRFGVTEGGGAPMLIVDREGETASFVFADPEQVSSLITVLTPYGKEAIIAARRDARRQNR